MNLGLHKVFSLTEQVKFQLGAVVDNIFDHPLLSPDADAGGGYCCFARLGSFSVRVDPATLKILPVAPGDITRNDGFGRLISSFKQEGVNNRRTVRLRLRITF